MKSVFKKIFSVFFAVLIVAGAINLSACNNGLVKKSDAFICKKEDFTGLKSNIYKSDGYSQHTPGDMINSKALAKAQNKLTKGEKYYLVFVLYADNWNKNRCLVNFEICDVSGIYHGNEAVSIHSISYDSATKISFAEDFDWADFEQTGSFELSHGSSSAWGRLNYTYMAIEFTPKQSGTLSTEAIMGSSGAMSASENNWDVKIDLQVSVFEHEYYKDNSSEATVSNLRYKRSVTDNGYVFSVNFDMDITKAPDTSSELYCVIYLHSGTDVNGPWDSVTVDTADTGTFKHVKSEYGKMLLFSYSAGAVEKKSAEILLEFDDMGDMDIDIFITGDGVCVDGNVRDSYVANYD